MFQKLYRHLEQINANTRQQQIDPAQTELWAEKISAQLDVLNTSVRSLNDRPRRRNGARIAGFFLAGMALALLGILSTYTFRLSNVADVARDRSTASLQAYGIVNNRYNEVNDKALDLEARTARLDSLVQDQNKTIQELKKLNTSAIHTIFFLQRKLQQQVELEHTQALVR